jgi:hypothetical protein
MQKYELWTRRLLATAAIASILAMGFAITGRFLTVYSSNQSYALSDAKICCLAVAIIAVIGCLSIAVASVIAHRHTREVP